MVSLPPQVREEALGTAQSVVQLVPPVLMKGRGGGREGGREGLGLRRKATTMVSPSVIIIHTTPDIRRHYTM